MAEQGIGQDDEPAVLGCGCGIGAMPTDAERREVWGRVFVRHAVDSGVLEKEHAEELFKAGADEWDYSMTPADALAEEISYWDNDGEENDGG